jgi:hypothetical protein
MRRLWLQVVLAALLAIFLTGVLNKIDFARIFGLSDFLYALFPKAEFDPRVFSAILSGAVAIVLTITALSTSFLRLGEGVRASAPADPLTELGGPPDAPGAIPSDAEARQNVISNLDRRISNLSGRSTIIYWTILITLVGGVILIIFAGYLSALDSTLAGLVSKIDSDRDAVIEIQNINLRRLEPDPRIVGYVSDRMKFLDDLYKTVVQSRLTQLATQSEGKSDWHWPSTILRVGIIGLIIFLTQILISLYRYNSRLIAFYASRREAFVAAEKINLPFTELAELLYPRDLDFGREPRHPFVEIGELFTRGRKGKDEPRAASPQPEGGAQTRSGRRKPRDSDPANATPS